MTRRVLSAHVRSGISSVFGAVPDFPSGYVIHPLLPHAQVVVANGFMPRDGKCLARLAADLTGIP